jgi:hypothetical protein
MTEAEWFTCADVNEMFTFLWPKRNERRTRLFFCAASRTLWHHLTHERSRVAVETAERYVDGLATAMELQEANYWAETPTFAGQYTTGEEKSAAEVVWKASGALANFRRMDGFFQWHFADVPLRGCGLLRDIFGNPFRPVTFSPEWQTDTALALARQMYDAREFSAMPILADALQDAGCDNDDILSHCRDANATHVRGCWVVDLVLGKG